jgi:aryl-alcohol dehydrogenase-like predicted oxidoreductase
MSDFVTAPFGKQETPVFRLGLAATYRPGRETVHAAVDAGVNYFFYFGFDGQMTGALREVVRGRRERFVLATGGYNFILWRSNLRRTIEARLRQMRTDYIDVFHYLGTLSERDWTARVAEDLEAVRHSGLVRAVSVSTHDFALARKLASSRAVDALMVRYNAAHRGAETEVFPYLGAGGPEVVGFTATRWSCLTRRPKGYPAEGRVPTAGMCYRFVLSNPHVRVCLSAPANRKQFEENLAEVRKGTLDEEEMRFMRGFGDIVAGQHSYFL